MTHVQLVNTIRRRMKKLDMSPYRLHQELSGRIEKQTVYNFLEHDKAVTTESLVAILTILKLSIRDPDEREAK